ncbi:MAG TPA: bifunctional nicotinamidase/pyrazinamidase [Nannocystis exedens]|nr:bifunctional nicotinamidase/pyrazinamidase [Nannocystis exedens]
MRALIVVDLQNDFMPGGALAVADGDAVVAVANRLMPLFEQVVATQDWHPADHGSFAAQHRGKSPGQLVELDGLQQVLWPTHCVQGSEGAAFHRQLDVAAIDRVFTKGEDPRVDSYSGFFDNGRRRATGLADYLRDVGVDEIYVLGLATDYCVKFTALDAQSLGFRTVLVADGCRAVNLRPEDGAAAIAEMIAAGIEVVASTQVGEADR